MLSLPKEISFNYVPKEYMTSTLKLTNLEDHPVIFKIKTNAPDHYLLSSHTGIIQRQSYIETSITMKPISFNPQNGSLSDLFLVQVMALPNKSESVTFFNLATFQKIFANTPKSSVESYKLKVALRLDSLSSSSGSGRRNSESLMDSFMSEDFKSIRRNESSYPENVDSGVLTMSFGQRLSTGSNTQNELFAPGNPDSPDSSKVSLAESQTFPSFIQEKEELVKEKEKIEDKETDKGSEKSREEELLQQSEKQKNLLLDLSQENTRLKDELMNLKKSTFQGVTKRNEKLKSQNEYQLWHVLLTAIFGMMLGALLTPN